LSYVREREREREPFVVVGVIGNGCYLNYIFNI